MSQLRSGGTLPNAAQLDRSLFGLMDVSSLSPKSMVAERDVSFTSTLVEDLGIDSLNIVLNEPSAWERFVFLVYFTEKSLGIAKRAHEAQQRTQAGAARAESGGARRQYGRGMNNLQVEEELDDQCDTVEMNVS